MHADRVDVFHRADGDDVSLGVADDLELDLLPAGDALLNQDLGDWGQAQAVAGNLAELLLIVSNTAASAAHGERRTDDDRVLDLLNEGKTVLDGVDNLGRDAGLADLFHGVLEHLTVLRLVDGGRFGAQEFDVVGIQEAFLCQLHREGKACLSAEVGEDAVRLFDLDDSLDDIQIQRLDVDVVGHRLIGHDGGRVGVYQYNLQALLFQGAAGLCARIVKLRCLSDDDRAGADYQYLFNILS